MRLSAIAIPAGLLSALLLGACGGPGQVARKPGSKVPSASAGRDARDGGAAAASASGQGRVRMQVYLMSRCPFGVQAMSTLGPAVRELGPRVKLGLDYIVSERDGEFVALHGDREVEGNIQQLCAIHSFPRQDQWLTFVGCVNERWEKIPMGWERCARQAGMDLKTLRTCIEGPRGKQLLRQSAERARLAEALGSPTIVVDGERYQGGRGKLDFMRLLCGAFKRDPPAACAKVPPPVEVKMTVLNDRRCGQRCEVDKYVENLTQRWFPGLKVRTLDYGDPEGKELFQKLGLRHLPALLFHPGVEKADRYAVIERWLRTRGDYRQLRIPAPFDPTAEICDNRKDDTGNGKVDCDDDDCRQVLVCRKEIPQRLDVFVMSQCPFGVQAVDAMQEVLAAFKGRITFGIHYIVTETAGGFSSLHGQPEVQENIRQLCARKHHGRGNRYLKYIWCRNKDYRSEDWQPCAKDGVSARRIARCAEGPEGRRLLSEDLKVARALEINASPTWLANNRHKFNGITAEAIKTEFCKHNPGLKGCSKTLSNDKKPAGACGN
jgi:hypothetical protein